MRKSLFMIVLIPLILSGCKTGWKAGAPEGAPDVIAHRGASAYAPENTLAAFEKAVEMKADWFELDCMLTGGGEVIVIHNSDVEKTTNAAGPVSGMTLAELQELDAGSWFAPEFAGEKLPALEEALDMAENRIGVYCEIKSSDDDGALHGRLLHASKGHSVLTPGLRSELMTLIEESGTKNLELTRKCIAAIRARNMKHQVVIQSFSPVICFAALMEAPEIRTEFLGSYDEEKPHQWEHFLHFGYLTGVAGFNIHHESLTAERLEAFHRGGKTVAVWTVDDPLLMKRYAAMGVDAIITNKPDRCMAVLKEKGLR
jgi:glycerophosphoryl diester phosphodiesterase